MIFFSGELSVNTHHRVAGVLVKFNYSTNSAPNATVNWGLSAVLTSQSNASSISVSIL